MMYGLHEKFEYFQCGACGCIQIVNVPKDMGKYYPSNYYSYTDTSKPKKGNFFKIEQCKHIVRGDRSWFARLITWKYKAPEYYEVLKNLRVFDLSAPVLDVGSGSGELLKNFYTVGYKDLTGVDPFLEKDIFYDKQFRIEKKGLFDLTRKYAAIMLHHSLEHMDHQEEVMKKIYEILVPDGRVMISIPVVSRPLMEKFGVHVVSLDPPRHFYIHTMKSFTMVAEKAGFAIEKRIYDAHEFSFWASEQYQRGISLHNNPESYLVKKTFTDEQMQHWKRQIEGLNEKGESDTATIYLKKKI